MDNKQKNEIKVSFFYTDEDILDIVVTALEGGIGYWACLDNTGKDFEDEPKDMPTSEWCWELLKQGKKLHFIDDSGEEEEETDYYLDMASLYAGIGKAISNQSWDGDMDTLDALVADSIFQYAIFDDVIYG